MQRYDPLAAPDREAWLALDEGERIDLVEQYHRRARIKLPNLKLHAASHVIVENQIALGQETPAQRTAERLIKEGLDRHQAIHAIGAILMGHIFELMKAPSAGGDQNPGYYAALEALTVEGWRRDYG
jgi:hypothetical protein